MLFGKKITDLIGSLRFDLNLLCIFTWSQRLFVLGSARTGLIFTRIQEGAEPGGLTQPGQTEQGIPYHVPSCWVPVGGELRGGK